MTTFRVEDGVYVPYFATVVDDAEQQLETDLENNPHVIMAPAKLLYIGRQTLTPDGRALDLLAVTADRRPVIIELKKNRTPREMMAQALEYAAFIDRSSNDEINTRAVAYFNRGGHPWTSLREAHEAYFEGSILPDPDRAWELVSSPIIVLEGQTIAPQLMDVAFFLRKHEIDVRVVQLSYQIGPAGERLVTVVQLLASNDEEVNVRAGAVPYELLLKTAAAAGVFERLCADLRNVGLTEKKTVTGVSYQLPRGGTIASVWLSAKGDRAYFQVYARYVPNGIDAFDEAATELGFRRERGTNVSVHVYPAEADRIPSLMEAFRAHCLGLIADEAGSA